MLSHDVSLLKSFNFLGTPILLIFDNIKTLSDTTHLGTLELSEETMMYLKDC